MAFALAVALAASAARADEPALGGVTGLLTIPTANVVEQGFAAAGVSRYNPKPATAADVDNYYVTLGLLPGFELQGLVVDVPGTLRDLSANAKLRLWRFESGAAIAVGVQDVGGQAQNFRSRYVVATLPWQDFSLTLGYDAGPDVMKGAIGGLEYRPWRFLALAADYDTHKANGGIKLLSDPIFGGLRIGATGVYRGATRAVEYGAHFELPLGRAEPALPTRATPSPAAEIPPARDPDELRAELRKLGFESVAVGSGEPHTLAVALENRRYNQSSADGVGLALGTIATRADPADRIELTLLSYGVPQLTVTVPAERYRAFLRDPGAEAPALRAALEARPADALPAGVKWSAPPQPLRTVEVVAEPVLRTFVATEYGVLDYGLGARARITAPITTGLVANLGVQAPLLLSDDFRGNNNFSPLAPEGSVDLAVLQYLHKLSPNSTWLWSAGRTQVYRADLRGVALEQGWISDEGTQLFRTKLMALRGNSGARRVALGGYTWFDPVRDYSVSFTGGRFYAGDSGVRVELNRYFGDTICGVFFKAASRDDQAAGVQISLPLTPRQDMAPRALQLKGPRRWSHSLSTTINSYDSANHLRPLLLFEPQLDLDLRRDVLDSGRLGEAYLRDELPRMYEAYELYGTETAPTDASAPVDTR